MYLLPTMWLRWSYLINHVYVTTAGHLLLLFCKLHIGVLYHCMLQFLQSCFLSNNIYHTPQLQTWTILDWIIYIIKLFIELSFRGSWLSPHRTHCEFNLYKKEVLIQQLEARISSFQQHQQSLCEVQGTLKECELIQLVIYGLLEGKLEDDTDGILMILTPPVAIILLFFE